MDVDPATAGIQPERTQTFYGLDGQINYELIATSGGDLTKDYVYDTQGRVRTIDHFADTDGNHTYDTGETLISGFTYQYNADGNRQSETVVDQFGQITTQSWVYDGLNHVSKDTFDGYDGQGNALKYTDTMSYDLSSNRVSTICMPCSTMPAPS